MELPSESGQAISVTTRNYSLIPCLLHYSLVQKCFAINVKAGDSTAFRGLVGNKILY